ncbi:MAG: hypothetical protein JSV20_08125 [Candidatus Bathyarchaeota archaeon]|nr:MAG: hypothetical protein JSV20_08125 [Candidatus Bathyarchaeota archaeon]
MIETTHTLHRQGDSLKEDYVVLTMSAKGVNEEGASPKLARSLKIMLKAGAVNLGDMKTGNIYRVNLEQMINHVDNRSIVHGVFVNKNDLIKVLCFLKDADLGMSVVVSGVFDEVFGAVKKTGLKPHSVNISLGVWGKRELLPREEYLKISTMCGHGMISPFLIEKLVLDVKKERVTLDKASRKLAECCVCGVFNSERAAKLIRNLTGRVP